MCEYFLGVCVLRRPRLGQTSLVVISKRCLVINNIHIYNLSPPKHRHTYQHTARPFDQKPQMIQMFVQHNNLLKTGFG